MCKVTTVMDVDNTPINIVDAKYFPVEEMVNNVYIIMMMYSQEAPLNGIQTLKPTVDFSLATNQKFIYTKVLLG